MWLVARGLWLSSLWSGSGVVPCSIAAASSGSRLYCQGRANYSMKLDRYEAVPASVQKELVAKSGVKQ